MDDDSLNKIKKLNNNYRFEYQKTIFIEKKMPLNDVILIDIINIGFIFYFNIIFYLYLKKKFYLNMILANLIIYFILICYFEQKFYKKTKNNFFFRYDFYFNISYIIFILGLIFFNKSLLSFFCFLPNFILNSYLTLLSENKYRVINSGKKLLYSNQMFFILYQINFDYFSLHFNFLSLFLLLIFSILLESLDFILVLSMNKKKLTYYIFYTLVNLITLIYIIYFCYNLFGDYKNDSLLNFLFITELILPSILIIFYILWKNDINKFYTKKVYEEYKQKKFINLYFKPKFKKHIQKVSEYFFKYEDNEIDIENSNLEKTICIICYSNKAEYLLDPCNHLLFCQDCVIIYFELKKFCPICKKYYEHIYYITKEKNLIFSVLAVLLKS